MARPSDRERMEHVLKAIDAIHSFVEGMDEKKFGEDMKTQSAVQYQFLVIGEAIKEIDSAILVKHNYPWHIPRSFRNFIIHVYHGIKIERIYFATQDLGPLRKVMVEMIESEIGYKSQISNLKS
jgi:uncharacterized protein with HEPN domain